MANKKAARFARRHVHTGLPAVDPDSVQKQALEGLEHPDLEELEQETEEVHTLEGLAEDLRVFDQESGKRLRSHSPPGADLRPVRTIPTPPTRKVAPREKRALPKPPPTPPPRRPLPAPAPVVLAPTPKSTPGQLSPELREELREKVKAYRVKREKRVVPEVEELRIQFERCTKPELVDPTPDRQQDGGAASSSGGPNPADGGSERRRHHRKRRRTEKASSGLPARAESAAGPDLN